MVKIKGQIKSENDAINRGYLDDRNPYVLNADMQGLYAYNPYQGSDQEPVEMMLQDLEDLGLTESALIKLSQGYYTKIFDNFNTTNQVWNYCCQGSYDSSNLLLKFWWGDGMDGITLIKLAQDSSGDFNLTTLEV